MVRVSTPGDFGEIALTTRGPPLIEFMDNMEILDRDVNAPFMFPVSEKYNEMGTMVMGKIESGRVKKGDTVLVMPNKVSWQVLDNWGRS
jgi:peptide chain release factor subunit 3